MKPLPTAHVPHPELTYDAAGQPYSAQFGDVYFSKSGGAAETHHVFLNGNQLPERFHEKQAFTIAEIGFGTGLNFLTTWREFLRTTPQTHHLHYIAVEKYPLTAEAIASLYTDGQADALLSAYPLRLPGWHQLQFQRCTLTLGFGDAADLLASIDAQVDAWFLDGFAPAKNPDMWGEAVLKQLPRLSARFTTIATFTAAGAVKRGLQAQGFTVSKVKGFGHKRDMLVGSRTSSSRDVDSVDHNTLRHCEAPLGRGNPSLWNVEEDGLVGLRLPSGRFARNNGASGSANIIIIGAGIAGSTLARALAERGHKVTLLERNCIASGASGNPAAVLYPQLTKFYTPSTAWHFTAYSFMLRQIARWKQQGMAFTTAQIGMLRLPRPEQRASDFASLAMDASIMRYVTRDEASALAGAPVASDGWWFPHGTWLAPAELCRDLLQHEQITLREHADVTSAKRAHKGWEVTLANGDAMQSDILSIAAAQEAPRLLPDLTLPMGVSAGQVSLLPADATAAPLQSIISHRGYIIPQADSYLLGATYDRSDLTGSVTEKNHAENLQHAQGALPGWITQDAALQGRTSLRATTPDRLPYVGEVGQGLYVSIGHGSRGMISAPLAAEIIASHINGETIPLSRELLASIHPRRRG